MNRRVTIGLGALALTMAVVAPLRAQPDPSVPVPDPGAEPDPGAGPDRAEPNQAEPDQAEPDQAEPDQAEPDQAEPDQAEPDQAEPDQAEPEADEGKPPEPDDEPPDNTKRPPEADGPEPETRALPSEGAPQDGPVIEVDEQDAFGAKAEPEGPAPSSGRAGETMVDRTGTSRSKVTFGGYGQHEFIARQNQNSRFRNHRYVLFVHGQISERVSTSTEIEFEFAGSPLKKDGTLGPGEVLLEYSVLDFKVAEWLTLRAGVILVPVGSFNINHDAPGRELVDRPIAYTTIVPTTWFESGAGLLGKIPLPADQTLSYEAYVVNGLDARIYDGFGMRAARGSHFEDNNSDKAVVGRLAYSPFMNVELGLSGYTGAYDTRGRRVNMANVDFLVKVGQLKLLGEAVYASVDPGFVEGFSASSPANTRDAVPTGMWGYYGQASYRIPVGETFGFTGDLADANFNLSLRYEAKNTDTDHFTSAGDARRLTAGVNFRPVSGLVVKSDFQWNSKGQDLQRDAPDVWQKAFWQDRERGYLFDAWVASVAYLF